MEQEHLTPEKYESLLQKLDQEENLSWAEIVAIITTPCPGLDQKLFSLADRKREKYVGEEIHLRGIIEFSNYCRKNCLYCGLRRDNSTLPRYRMKPAEIIEVAQKIVDLGIPTVVLQSGEDLAYPTDLLAEIVFQVKKIGAAVTLSIGERDREDYLSLYQAGADRFLLKQETFDRNLFGQIHSDDNYDFRLACQKILQEIGFQTGSGNMVGLPEQKAKALALDIKKFQEWNFDMIGIGPFIPHPKTPLGKHQPDSYQQLILTLKVLALTRILTKNSHLPATTALGVLSAKGRETALCCGANVIMPDFTPIKYQTSYNIYPGKSSFEEGEYRLAQARAMIKRLGRKETNHPGHSLKRHPHLNPLPRRERKF